MSGFAIIAELPLGTYRAHRGGVEMDSVPSPARLHAALLSAAAQGVRAECDGTELRARAADREALVWLEAHPPDGMALPGMTPFTAEGVAYRETVLGMRKRRRVIEKPAKPLEAVAVDGAFGYIWTEAPPAPVREAIETLLPDVSHLGMAESPVRLRLASTLEPSHVIDRDATLWERAAGDHDLVVAKAARTAVLEEAHQTLVSTKARDAKRARSKEDEVWPPVVSSALATCRYRPRELDVRPGPWSTALVAELPIEIWPQQRVTVARWVHRALIAIVGDGAPPALTGHYPPDAARPANRVAIQLLDKAAVGTLGWKCKGALALLLPDEIDTRALTAVAAAWGQLSSIRVPGLERRVSLGLRSQWHASRFWPAPSAGLRRLWRTAQVAVPDVRAQGAGWSIEHAVALSLALVYRNDLDQPGRGRTRYQAMAQAAHDRGVRVISAHELRRGDLSRYVHRAPEHLVVRPYEALLSLGHLADDGTLLAIGQSRHLGGGLLAPFDVPDESAMEFDR